MFLHFDKDGLAHLRRFACMQYFPSFSILSLVSYFSFILVKRLNLSVLYVIFSIIVKEKFIYFDPWYSGFGFLAFHLIMGHSNQDSFSHRKVTKSSKTSTVHGTTGIQWCSELLSEMFYHRYSEMNMVYFQLIMCCSCSILRW